MIDNNILKLNYYQIKENNNIINWIKYIPKKWNIELILKKDKKDLNSNDLLILYQYSADREKLSLINELLKYQKEYNNNIEITKKELKKRNNLANQVNEIILSFSIEKYAKIKLSPYEIKEVLDKLELLSSFNTTELNDYLTTINNNSLKQQYLTYLLKNLLIEKRKELKNKKTKKIKLKPKTRKPYYKFQK